MIATFVLVALVLALFAIGLGLENRRVVSGTVAIAAPQDTVYELVSDLKTGWPEWSPLLGRGNGLALEYGPQTSGAGAMVRWTGKAGTGCIELTDCTPGRGLSYHTTTSFGGMSAAGKIELRRDPSATVVSWHDELSVGANPIWKWLARALDGLRQQNVNRGLAALKRVAEEGKPSGIPPTPAAVRPFPSGLIAFVFALLAACAFVVDGYLEMRAGRGCDGGTCAVALLMGLVKGAAALMLGFPSLWLLIAAVRRLVRDLQATSG